MIIKVEEIEAEVTKKDVRRINMRVYPDGKIKISVPKRVKNDEIELFIRERLDWIRKTKGKLSSEIKKRYLFDFEKDKTVFIFGEEFQLEKNPLLSPGVTVGEGKITVGTKGLSDEESEKLPDGYFKKLLFEKLSVLVPKWERITGLEASSWRIKKVKSYWGKCKVKTKEILFNQNLVHYPNECIEYVVLHELSHIRYPDHQKGFKSFLSKHMPDWKRISNVLK
ncbi:MAG: SprT family zinc-dependent metalloprotease [Clostridia bacterium]|nr:SprT family zinc-dependent metalloprotease [Clostridia bacterium]